ncbi:hypothetical protein BGZ98_008413 [Dissophora globulifera]|nr:hypothetical protein BGZ98_008413 [Dissophora globulifera]
MKIPTICILSLGLSLAVLSDAARLKGHEADYQKSAVASQYRQQLEDQPMIQQNDRHGKQQWRNERYVQRNAMEPAAIPSVPYYGRGPATPHNDQTPKEPEKETERERKAREKEAERERKLREKEAERQRKEHDKEIEREKKAHDKEQAERERQQHEQEQPDKTKQDEIIREREKQHEQEQREKEKQDEMDRERMRQREQEQRDKAKQDDINRERVKQDEMDRERVRQREQEQREKAKQDEMDRQREQERHDKEKQAQIDREREKEQAEERERELQHHRDSEAEAEKQRELERHRQQERERENEGSYSPDEPTLDPPEIEDPTLPPYGNCHHHVEEPSQKSQKMVVAYWSDWTSAALPPEAIPFDKLTHINYAFSIVTPDFRPVFDTDYLLPRVVRAAHAKNVKVLMSIGGWTGSQYFSPLSSTAQGRKTFIDGAISMVKDFDLDGIDIDCKVVDHINVMAYDINGSWGTVTGANAPLTGTGLAYEDGAQAWINAGFPAQQINMGVPFYGRSLITKTDMTQAQSIAAPFHKHVPPGDNNDALWTDPCETGASYSGVWKFKNMREQGLIDENGNARAPWVRKFDEVSQTPWLFNPETKQFISYDDRQSLKLKVDFARQKDLGGVMLWALNQDTANFELLDVLQGVRQ